MVCLQSMYFAAILYMVIVQILGRKDQNLPKVQLTGGPLVIGQLKTTVDQNKTYHAFQGIPFAQPPIGELRFKSPLPFILNSSQTTLEAFTSSPICVQSDTVKDELLGSEDCLYLNVYVRSRQNNSLLPVMVWIYGGGFYTGDASPASYGPDYLLDRDDIIIVTLNYRVGIFGFLSTEDIVSPGNYGLKDQVLALKWIQTHIRSFGGDPGQVTIFGQSAGAVSISYLLQTSLTRGLFQKAIMQSGTALNSWALTKNPKAKAIVVAKSLGVDVSSSESLVTGLRNVPMEKLQETSVVFSLGVFYIIDTLNGMAFGPTTEPQSTDAIVVNKSHEQISKGLFHHVPLILGFNNMEGVMFSASAPSSAFRLSLIKYDLSCSSISNLVSASMNINSQSIRDTVNSRIKFYYFGLLPVAFSSGAFAQYISDDQFNRPILEATKLYSLYSPVYLYQFTYDGSIGSQNRTSAEVGHAEELPYVWNTASQTGFVTKDDELTRLRMTTLWTNFAKTGNPTPLRESIFNNVLWPLANISGTNDLTSLKINNKITTAINPNTKNEAFWKDLFEEYGNPPYSTY